ncbi:TRAP transporter substrate-binding protein [Falsigemmobacter faecalis]|uniref:C4-dicarboxylate ABC transporter substrate-binding protein n=1 Tax=Falsigemmobacter faecalis TaxID=2488730 RepID=A0A3P3DPM0_9RHOB|nr:TRAP transporter substrate-binding protein [Falsigemmobacter faecalis]RRH76203.1 C4-dicarboxylate ABC transporter substrate-binding protein [Falsigemmobacter faecalis]
MKQGKFFAVSVAFAAALTAAPAFAETRWDMSIVWPEGNFHTQNAMAFAEAVQTATEGEVVITVHSGGALGIKGPEAMAAVRDGIVPIAEILLNQQVGEAPVLGIETLPFLAPTMADIALLHKYYRPKLDEVASSMNQKLLYTAPWPGQAVYAPHAINTVEDLKGLTIRVVDSNGNDFFGALGATPIQMPWGEVVPSLAAGTIKGVTTSSSSGVDGAFWEFTKHMSTFNWQASSNIMSVNLDAWNALPLETREAIEKVGRDLEGQFWLNSRAEDDKKMAVLRENGVEITAPSAELSAQLMERALPLWDAFKIRVPDAAPVIDAYLAARK